MDREMIAAQLQDADASIALRQALIERQRTEVAELALGGRAHGDAREVLQRLEQAQALYRQHRDRLAGGLKT